MSEPRIPMLPVDDAKAAAAGVGIPEYMAELSVFRILLHHPELAARLNGLLHQLLWQGRLDPRLRELAIMRIGWVTGSVYEWTQHWTVALGLDIPPDDVLAVRDWRASDRLTAADRAVLAATDETLESGAVSAETWAEVETHLATAEERLELVAAIGNWRTFSQLLRTVEVPLEPGVEAWPPDGRSPAG